jgi:hypothetical protein
VLHTDIGPNVGVERFEGKMSRIMSKQAQILGWAVGGDRRHAIILEGRFDEELKDLNALEILQDTKWALCK